MEDNGIGLFWFLVAIIILIVLMFPNKFEAFVKQVEFKQGLLK